MRGLLKFIKTTAIGGLLVIIPLSIILFVLAQLFWGLYQLAVSITEDLGIAVNDAIITMLIAALALVGLCFVTGLIVQTRLGTSLRGWLSRKVAPKIPMYNALSNLTKRVVGVEGHEFSPVEIDIHGSESRALGFLVENLPDGRIAVFVPTAPLTTVGNIYILPPGSVTPLAASVTETINVITQWGVDSKYLYGAKLTDDYSD